MSLLHYLYSGVINFVNGSTMREVKVKIKIFFLLTVGGIQIPVLRRRLCQAFWEMI